MRAIENGVDERLLVEAAQKDPCRFAELYESNFERVYAYVARRVRDRDEAQDVTAEVFHQALANISRFEWRGAPFVAWLLGIAANVLASRWREGSGKNGRSPAQVPAGALDGDAVEDIGAEDDIERRAMLSQLLDSLPPEQRHVIVRRFVDQRSISEIAKEMQRSEGAIKQLQFRAVQTLRNRMRGSHA